MSVSSPFFCSKQHMLLLFMFTTPRSRCIRLNAGWEIPPQIIQLNELLEGARQSFFKRKAFFVVVVIQTPFHAVSVQKDNQYLDLWNWLARKKNLWFSTLAWFYAARKRLRQLLNCFWTFIHMNWTYFVVFGCCCVP